MSLARENRAKQRARGWISRERKERKPCFNTGVSTERKHFTVRMIRNLLKRWLKLPVQHVIKAKLIQYPINPEFTFKREGGTRYFPIKSVIALGFKISRRSSCWLHNGTKVWSRNDCTVSGRDRGSFWFSDRIGNFQCNWIDSLTMVITYILLEWRVEETRSILWILYPLWNINTLYYLWEWINYTFHLMNMYYLLIILHILL